ncbi:MAG: hypothetical protein ACREN0_08445, partial [Thermodesulfobacteriota bacterium]
GMIDEVRISDSERSSNWLDTCYNNQNSPGTFYALASAETPEICFTQILGILDKLTGVEAITQPARSHLLAEVGHFNDPFGVGGNLVDKAFIIAELFSSVETLNPNLQFTFNDDLIVVEVAGRVFEFIETFATTEVNDIENTLALIDSTQITDLLALAIYKELAEGATLSDAFQLLRMLPETFTLGDVVALARSSSASDGAGFGEKISITRSGTSETTDPDEIFAIRRSTNFVL